MAIDDGRAGSGRSSRKVLLLALAALLLLLPLAWLSAGTDAWSSRWSGEGGTRESSTPGRDSLTAGPVQGDPLPSEKSGEAEPAATASTRHGVLRGLVVDGAGRPARARVELRRQGQPPQGIATLDADPHGRYEGRVPLPEGDAILEVTAETPAGERAWPVLRMASEIEDGVPVFLLVNGVTKVKGRVVDSSGTRVAPASVALLVWPSGPGPPWLHAPADATRLMVPVRDDGRFDVVAPSGRLRAWARRGASRDDASASRPAGSLAREAPPPHGDPRETDLPAGEEVDLGDLVVPAGIVEVEVAVLRPDGSPAAGALLRLDALDTAGLLSQGGEGLPAGAHARAGADGVLRFSCRTAPEPLAVGIGLPDHSPVDIRIGRSAPASIRETLVLDAFRTRRIEVMPGLDGAFNHSAPPESWPELEVWVDGGGSSEVARRLRRVTWNGGDPGAPTRSARIPAEVLAHACMPGGTTRQEGPGRYLLVSAGDGIREAWVRAVPGSQRCVPLEFRAELDGRVESVPLPEGRSISFVVEDAIAPECETSMDRHARRLRYRVWLDPGPGSRHGDLLGGGWPIFEASREATRRLRLWVPDSVSQLCVGVRPREEPAPGTLPGPHGVSSRKGDDAASPAAPPIAFDVLSVPPDGGEIRYRVEAVSGRPSLAEVRVTPTHAGRPVAMPGLEVVARRVATGAVPYAEALGATDAEGVALLRLEPGRWSVEAGALAGGSEPVVVEIVEGRPGQELQVALLLRRRSEGR
jgi:hypothetical protein